MVKTETKSEKARRVGPPTYDRLKKKQARTKSVVIALDDELAEEVVQLRRAVERKRLKLAKIRGNGDDDPALTAELDQDRTQLDELEDRLEKESVTLRFRAIGRKRYEKLVGEYPPTKEQLDEAKKNENPKPEFNVDEFPAALVGASCYEPDLSEDSYWDDELERTRYPHAEEIFEEWNQGELTALFTAAWEVNTARRVVDQGNG